MPYITVGLEHDYYCEDRNAAMSFVWDRFYSREGRVVFREIGTANRWACERSCEHGNHGNPWVIRWNPVAA